MCQVCAGVLNFDPRRHDQSSSDYQGEPTAFGTDDSGPNGANGVVASDLVYGSSWGDTPGTLGDASGVVTYSIASAGYSLSAFGQGSIQSVDGSDFYPDIDYQAEIAAAFDLWSQAANIEFVQIEDGGGNPGGNRYGDIRFFFGEIPGSTIGLAFFPSFFSSSQIAGDIMLDDVNTNSSFGMNVFRALLIHEIGHALGLQHVPNGSNSVMTPTVGLSAPTALDAEALQLIYGVQDNAASVIDMDAGQQDLNIELGLNRLTVNGNGLDNTIDATDLSETLVGAGGQDTLRGQGGKDLIEGGDGNDLIFGGAQSDNIRAGSGDDVVNGDDGRDRVFLEDGADVFNDNNQNSIWGNDTVFGGDGNDTINGAGGDDAFYGGDGRDLIYGGIGNDLIFGGGQKDTIMAGSGDDTVAGDLGSDRVYLEDGNDVFNDNPQDNAFAQDTVFGGNGDDTINGSGGDDTFYGDDGADLVEGGAGNDLLFGGGQFDTIRGGIGDDTVFGGQGRDEIDLGQGNDRYEDSNQTGFWGADTITGGSGSDTFVFGTVVSDDVITDFEIGTDTLDLTSSLVSGRSAQQVIDDLTTITVDGVLITIGAGQSILLAGLNTTAGLANDISITDDVL